MGLKRYWLYISTAHNVPSIAINTACMTNAVFHCIHECNNKN